MKRAYAEYRDSGNSSVGDIPAHWRTLELARIGSFFKGGGGTKADETDEGLPCVRYGDLYTRHDYCITESRSRISPDRAATYTELQYRDLLFAGSGETLEEIGKSAVNLLREPAFCGGDVIILRPHIDADATFLGYAADSNSARHQKACMGRGVTVMHIYGSELKHLSIPLPPLDEQRSIGVYLDSETARIDKLISKQELLIARLDEYRTALITQVVTRGLPPEAAEAAGLEPAPRFKDSGVEWLGDVQEDWSIVCIRHLCRFEYGESLTAEERVEGNVPVYGSNGVVGFHDEPNTLAPVIIIGRKGSHGKLNFDNCEAFAIDTTYFVDPACTETDLRWLYYALHTAELDDFSKDSAVPGLSREDAYAKRLPRPPAAQQCAIARFLDAQSERIDRLRAKAELSIERLREYRSALVSAAVTGKIDVRDEVLAGSAAGDDV